MAEKHCSLKGFTLNFIAICHFMQVNFSLSLDIAISSIIANDGNLPYDYRRSGPAADMAIETINSRYNGTLNFTYIYRDPGPDCSENDVGAIAAKVFYGSRVSSFIGPGCSLAVDVIGRLAASWNLPIITPVGTKGTLGNKDNFPTLTRLAYNMNKFSNFYLQVFAQFNWTDVTIMYDKVHVFYSIVGTSLQAEFSRNGISSKLFEFDTSGVHDLAAMLQRASSRSRIFVISCHGSIFRKIMMTFYDLGMYKGDYAVIFIRLFNGDDVGYYSWRASDSNDEKARKAYESVLVVQPRRPESTEFLQFEQEVISRASRDYNYTYGDIEVNIFITALYDSFLLYAQVVNETIHEGGDYLDGRNFTQRIWGRTFEGIGGTIAIDENGDRDTDFSLLDMDRVTGNFRVIGNYFGKLKKFEFVAGQSIYWPNDRGPPVNRPVCGFNGDDPSCRFYVMPAVGIAGISFACVILLFGIVAFVVYRKLKLESDLQSMWWKIKPTDLKLASTTGSRALSRLSIFQSNGDDRSRKTQTDTQIFTTTSYYKGTRVAIKKMRAKQFNCDRMVLVDLKQMRDISCQNLTRFVGLSLDTGCINIVTEYCPRGSLQDIIENDSIQLDKDFKNALMTDLVYGMTYLHNSPIEVHGRLNSSNCVIDGRFVLKITDYGLVHVKSQTKQLDRGLQERAYLWIAPEHIRMLPDKCMSQAGDVYSFGIILFEILTRLEPFEEEMESCTIVDIVQKIRIGGKPWIRPAMPKDFEENDLVKLMKECYSEDPKLRPTFQTIKRLLREITGIAAGHNILDSLLRRMEQYANNLEDLVEERTQAFLDEKRKSEELLYQVLPRSVANQLKNGHTVDPESFDWVTIYFSDIVGFTSLSAASTPFQVVDLLNDLYTCFDSIIENFDVYKVETIGDAYMVVSGLPEKNGTEHVRQIARMSLSILKNVSEFRIRHLPDEALRARIGLHTGSVCAGVVGRKMPRYCLFGDTVNTASRMESNGEAMKIHMSDATKAKLSEYETFLIEERGEIPIKGKGSMTTYWLLGEERDTDEEV